MGDKTYTTAKMIFLLGIQHNKYLENKLNTLT